MRARWTGLDLDIALTHELGNAPLRASRREVVR